MKKFLSSLKKRGTKVSLFAILNNVSFDPTTAIAALAKCERTEIGKCTYIGTLSAVYDCKVGSFCSIARECYIGGASHPINWGSTSPCFHVKNNVTGVCYAENDYQWNQQTVIGNDVWLGIRVIVLSGVTIGNGAVIGAGSVVTKDVGAYEIWAGNPAKFIRKRFDDETIKKLEESKWWERKDDVLRRYGSDIVDVNKFIDSIEKSVEEVV